ncbi:glycoside hydrolase [Thiospirochaeta perfilievii]|uniref:beta-N-acetylhexosaminidase n=1 Tax=Thiospirochaeta perfilievii TaxID=252967 RepID=A0A5C1QA09_9SPIO|nr:glycoside hydrolase family 3 protein [Thiospirochaeta perfilievii]QEN03484.1 glycoside hydrolase [Thiospirochaeta perfilievii]
MKIKILYIILIILLFSCVTTTQISDDNEDISDNILIENPVDLNIEDIDKEAVLTKDELDRIKREEILEQMSLEERVGQLFIIQIRGYTRVDSQLKAFIQKYKPGGIILFSNNIENNEQVSTLIKDLQSINSLPMFIAVDEEGGIVSRLGKEKNVDVTHLPPALTIGNKNNPRLAYVEGKILGRELTALGFNMDMAPVADVNTNPQNPVIGNRTYSANQHIAGEMVVNVIKGMREEGLISVIKHFPGHGDTKTDSHLGAVVSPHNIDRLNQIEFVPFKRGIDSGVDVIMTAHIIMPGISNLPLPSTLNPEILTGILRNELGFNGLIMTDALDMGAITDNFSTKEAVTLGIEAGVDLLLIPANQKIGIESLIESVKNGEISEDRVNESALRILRLKQKSNLLTYQEPKESITDVKNDPKHRALIDSLSE